MTTPFILALLLSPFVAVVLWLFTEWILRNINEKYVPKIYVQPGFFYPLKYKIFRLILWLRKRQNDNRLRRKQTTAAGAGYGIQSRNSPEEMDRLQELSQNHPLVRCSVNYKVLKKCKRFILLTKTKNQL